MIDMGGGVFHAVDARAGLKCLSARFVIDIWPDWETLMKEAAAVSNAFRLDS